MSNYVTKDVLKTALKDQTDEIVGILQTFMQHVDDRFNEQDRKYSRLIDTIDAFISRIDKYETEALARDSQFERLLAWARKVSEKTGIPLENL